MPCFMEELPFLQCPFFSLKTHQSTWATCSLSLLSPKPSQNPKLETLTFTSSPYLSLWSSKSFAKNYLELVMKLDFFNYCCFF
ncbi:hypothetical protein CRYUN_Cryun20dG0043000 [Craigia yunnanensis]